MVLVFVFFLNAVDENASEGGGLVGLGHAPAVLKPQLVWEQRQVERLELRGGL